jgi:hypothetical protein
MCGNSETDHGAKDTSHFQSLHVHSLGMHIPDLAIYFLNGLSYDKSPTGSLIELRKTHILLMDTLS